MKVTIIKGLTILVPKITNWGSPDTKRRTSTIVYFKLRNLKLLTLQLVQSEKQFQVGLLFNIPAWFNTEICQWLFAQFLVDLCVTLNSKLGLTKLKCLDMVHSQWFCLTSFLVLFKYWNMWKELFFLHFTACHFLHRATLGLSKRT